jgi:hypothetical protein
MRRDGSRGGVVVGAGRKWRWGDLAGHNTGTGQRGHLTVGVPAGYRAYRCLLSPDRACTFCILLAS